MTSPSSSQARQPRRHPSSFKERVGRKMARVREQSPHNMEVPERFKVDEDDDDVDDGTGVGNGGMPMLAHQSMYGVIAATQSRVTFPTLFQQDSASESEDEAGDGLKQKKEDDTTDRKTAGQKQVQEKSSGQSRKDNLAVNKHGPKLSEDKLVRSFLKPIKEKGDSRQDDPMTQSQLLPPRDQPAKEVERPRATRTDAPVLDRKLQAMAKADMESSKSSLGSKSKGEKASEEAVQQKTSKSLPTVVANIFQFEEPEEVIAEYPCWYTQNVLLQGFMYVTAKHISFYSYLHQKTNTVIKQGNLGKQSKHGYRYYPYWFVLKGDQFSYFESSAEPFFPRGGVDLKIAISAERTTPETGKDATDFTITTPRRTYCYRAETSFSAREWVEQLQKAIFRSHNKSDSVKLSLALENVVDVEETKVFDSAETVMLRVLAGDDTFAIDEYFFTFNAGGAATKLLKDLTAGNDSKKAISEDESLSPLRKLKIASHSLSPSPRSRMSPRSTAMQESTESFVTSSEQADSTWTIDETINPDMSASMMLTDEGMFNRPTLSMPQPQRTGLGRAVERPQESHSSSRESSTERVRVQAPTRQPGGQNLNNDRPQLERQASGGSSRTVGAQDKKMSQPVDIKGPGSLVRGISMPLHHAMTVAEMVRSSGKQISSYLSSSPKTYISNFSEAFVGGKRHYTDVDGLAPDDSVQDADQDVDVAEHERRFRGHFGMPETEKLHSVFYCWLHRTIPLYGKIYISSSRFCFRSLLYGVGTKLIIPYQQIVNVQKKRGFRWGYPGMVLVIRGYEELFFDFPSNELRDEAVVTVFRNLDTGWEAAAQSMLLTEQERQNAADAAAENESLQEARQDGHADHNLQLPAPDAPPILFDDHAKPKLEIKPKKSLRIVCLTIGTRGDVQPFIALCKGLIADGHRPKIATHAEYKDWIEGHGIEFAEVAGDPAKLIKVCVEHGMFTPRFIFEVNYGFREWLDDLCRTALPACGDADVMIESPVAMVGIHIAEALQIPYFRAFGMPWTRTRAYPHAMAAPRSKQGGAYNYVSYTLLENIMWGLPAWQINSWRRKTLDLPPTSLGELQTNRIPFLYNFSPSVVTPPLDYSDWIKITGYWFLDEGKNTQPPEDLVKFIKKAKDDRQKLVFIGFGSVTVSDSKVLTQNIVDAVVKADVRCILSKGWSDRFAKEDPDSVPIELPSCIYQQIGSIPHDWLFTQIDAAVHHGGAGTTGASLRAGVPTVIKPFFGDQFFFASRVEDLGVGMHLKKVTANQLSRAIWLATHDERMRKKAAILGEQIRAENGVETAIHTFYSYMDYAESLIKGRSKDKRADGQEEEDTEEIWTFVSDADLPAAGEEGFDKKGGGDDLGGGMQKNVKLGKGKKAET